MTQPEFNQTIAKLRAEVSQLERNLKPKPTTFVAVSRVVMLGSYCVCRAKSNTFAIRIARALNNHKPDERGR